MFNDWFEDLVVIGLGAACYMIGNNAGNKQAHKEMSDRARDEELAQLRRKIEELRNDRKKID